MKAKRIANENANYQKCGQKMLHCSELSKFSLEDLDEWSCLNCLKFLRFH